MGFGEYDHRSTGKKAGLSVGQILVTIGLHDEATDASSIR